MSVEFRFNKMIYRQIDGIVMRSPLGLTMANIFVFFQKDLFAHIEGFQYYVRYMDNTFCVIEVGVFTLPLV